LSAGATTIAAGALQAGITALVSQATISLANNNGDLGKVLKEMGSSESVKNLVAAMLTGGTLAGMNLNPTGLPTLEGGNIGVIQYALC
jgi:filamentous hemagglutinin